MKLHEIVDDDSSFIHGYKLALAAEFVHVAQVKTKQVFKKHGWAENDDGNYYDDCPVEYVDFSSVRTGWVEDDDDSHALYMVRVLVSWAEPNKSIEGMYHGDDPEMKAKLKKRAAATYAAGQKTGKAALFEIFEYLDGKFNVGEVKLQSGSFVDTITLDSLSPAEIPSQAFSILFDKLKP